MTAALHSVYGLAIGEMDMHAAIRGKDDGGVKAGMPRQLRITPALLYG
jgi:hypothetical protein